MRKFYAVLLLMLFAELAGAELQFKALSATSTSQTFLFARQANSVMICNLGANEVYYRLFDSNDTPAAATTSYPMIPAGSTTAPVCVSVDKSQSNPGLWAAIAVKCDTAETATVHVIYQ